MFDNTCKFLAENYPQDFAQWLLGQPIPLTALEPSELSLEPIRADSLILLASSQTILHLEFQTLPKSNLPFRMVDYYVRLYRKFPQHQIRQFIIYLLTSESPLVRQTRFETEHLTHSFNIVRLWEQATEPFYQLPGLLPLAVLTQTSAPDQTLRQVSQIIETFTDEPQHRDLTAASALIAGLKLEQAIVNSLFRSEVMKESVIYQEILQEGKIEGKIEGKLEGKLEGKIEGKIEERLNIARNLLGLGLSEELIAQATGLSPAAIRTLL